MRPVIVFVLLFFLFTVANAKAVESVNSHLKRNSSAIETLEGKLNELLKAQPAKGKGKNSIALKLENNGKAIKTLEGKLGELSKVSLPVGTILAWDPIIRSANGNTTGETRPQPRGWKVCNGQDGTPNLTSIFLMGTNSTNSAGQVGGEETILSNGKHKHSAKMENGVKTGYHKPNASWWGKKSDHLQSHQHAMIMIEDGDHGHGENRPPYYTVVFIIKTE